MGEEKGGGGRRAALAACTCCSGMVVVQATAPPTLPPPLLQVDLLGVGVVTLAAFFANTLESYIGAGVQGRVSWLTNDVVNVIQICVAAAAAVALRLAVA